MLIDIVVAFLVSVLTGMGMGSAGLMVIYLTSIRNLGQLDAQGANMILFIGSTIFSLILQIIRKMIRWKTVIAITLAGCIGIFIGYAVAKSVDSGIVKDCFAALLILSGTISLVKIAKDKRSR